MTTGWIKTRKHWRKVCVVARYMLPATEAVRWRQTGGTFANDCISSAAEVLPEPPLDSKAGKKAQAYRNLLAQVWPDWSSIHEIAERANRFGAGVWPMLSAMQKDGLVETRTIQRTPRTSYCEARLSAKSATHDFDAAIAKCRELELELADCKAACLEYQAQAEFQRGLNYVND